MFDKKKLKQFGPDFNFVLEAQKPSDFQLQAERDKAGKLINYSEDHVLNTAKMVAQAKTNQNVTSYCFEGNLMVTSYGDGLICVWDIELGERDIRIKFRFPLFGHLTKVNHLKLIDKSTLASCGQDCTTRIWNLQEEKCERVFKFSDPATYSCADLERNLLFVGSYDRSVKAIDLKTGEVDRSFIASREAIKCLLIHENCLYVAGDDQVIREFNLVSGESRIFEGHTSWVLCLLAYVVYNADGSVKSTWLLSGSDDNTVRIWDIKTGKCLEELIGHKNGVTCMTLARNDLFTGSYDTCTIRWSL